LLQAAKHEKDQGLLLKQRCSLFSCSFNAFFPPSSLFGDTQRELLHQFEIAEELADQERAEADAAKQELEAHDDNRSDHEFQDKEDYATQLSQRDADLADAKASLESTATQLCETAHQLELEREHSAVATRHAEGVEKELEACRRELEEEKSCARGAAAAHQKELESMTASHEIEQARLMSKLAEADIHQEKTGTQLHTCNELVQNHQEEEARLNHEVSRSALEAAQAQRASHEMETRFYLASSSHRAELDSITAQLNQALEDTTACREEIEALNVSRLVSEEELAATKTALEQSREERVSLEASLGRSTSILTDVQAKVAQLEMEEAVLTTIHKEDHDEAASLRKELDTVTTTEESPARRRDTGPGGSAPVLSKTRGSPNGCEHGHGEHLNPAARVARRPLSLFLDTFWNALQLMRAPAGPRCLLCQLAILSPSETTAPTCAFSTALAIN